MPPRASKASEPEARGRSGSRPAMAIRQRRGAIAGPVPGRRRQHVIFLSAGVAGACTSGNMCVCAREVAGPQLRGLEAPSSAFATKK
eukprot:13590092-Alexandrium_andersonii.AAC.1